MNIYLPDGWLDAHKVLKVSPYQFSKIIMVGGRGIGKSYGVLEELLLNHPEKIFYIRTKQKEIDLMVDPDLNPFQKLNLNRNTLLTMKKKQKEISMVTRDPESNEPIALVSALSTISDVRGMNAEHYTTIFYDEFIPEKHVRKMRHQGTAVKHMYETLNRNRELEGKPPMRLIMCANSEDLSNDVLVEYNVIDDLIEMKEKGIELKDFPERSLRLVYPQFSPISKKKRETAQYKGEAGDYERMALNNEFTHYYKGNIASLNLSDFEPKVIVGDLCIYKSKNSRILYITTYAKGKFVEQYNLTDFEIDQFKMRHRRLMEYYFKNKIKFETPSCEIKFQNLWS